MDTNTIISRARAWCHRLCGRHAGLFVLLIGAAVVSVTGQPLDELYQAHFSQIMLVSQESPLSTKRSAKRPSVMLYYTVPPWAPVAQEQQSAIPGQVVGESGQEPVVVQRRISLREPVRIGPVINDQIELSIVPTQPVLKTRVRRAAPEPVEPLQEAAPAEPGFPVFDRAILPVSKTPNWGIMRSPSQWERSYVEMSAADFVPVPRYNLEVLTTPMEELLRNLTQENMDILTAKLFYSTRFFGRYHLDSGEYEGPHVGIDLKLAPGTPIGAVAGGQVHGTGSDKGLGNYVMILHRLPESAEEVVSIYGHLQSVAVSEGEAVTPDQVIGYAGNTGNSESAHLHLQIDRKTKPGRHQWYVPGSVVSRSEWSRWTYHPLEFIAEW